MARSSYKVLSYPSIQEVKQRYRRGAGLESLAAEFGVRPGDIYRAIFDDAYEAEAEYLAEEDAEQAFIAKVRDEIRAGRPTFDVLAAYELNMQELHDILKRPGEKAARALTREKAALIKAALGEGAPVHLIAKEANVSPNVVRAIKHGAAHRGTAPAAVAPGWKAPERQLHHGSQNQAAVLTEAEVSQIKAGLQAGQSQSSLARRFGVSRNAIQDIQNGKTWTHVAPASSPPPAEDRSRARRSDALLSEAEVAVIRQRLAAGEQGKALAGEYGVSKDLISLIKRGKR